MFEKWIDSIKAFPPSGGFLSPFSILREYFREYFNPSSELLEDEFPNHICYLTNSGKSSLYVLLKAIRALKQNREVAIAAYTCPDIASSAVKAGFKIRLIDLEPDSTSIKASLHKVQGCAAVILSNLYGIPDDVEDLEEVFIIDDACQSALSYRNVERVGVSENKIGIFSFGRGKAFAASGGGLLLVPKSFDSLNLHIEEILQSFDKSSFTDFAVAFVKNSIYYIFEWPMFYRIVTLIPGLGIGETNVASDFDVKLGGRFEKIVLKLSLRYAENRRVMQIVLTNLYIRLFSESENGVQIPLMLKENKISLVRFPILVSSEKRAELFTDGRKILMKYGISQSYPKTLKEYFNQDNFSNYASSFPNSENIKNRLLTLPIGPYVNEFVFKSIKKILTKGEK